MICIYSSSIFQNITLKGGYSKYLIKEENNFIGWSAVIGACMSYFTITLLSRRALFVGGHFIMCVLMFLTGFYVDMKKHDLALVCILLFIVVFQCTQGTAIFIYISEIVSSDSVMGLCLFAMMFGLTVQSMAFTQIMNSKLGVNGLFYVLGACQIIAFVVLSIFMKETKGLTAHEKKELYSSKKSN